MPKTQGYYSNATGKPGKGKGSSGSDAKHPTPKQMKQAQKQNPFAKAAKASRGK